MNKRMICRVLGWIFLIYAALMILPLLTGLIYHENVFNFLLSIAITALLGLMLMIPKPCDKIIVARDGFVIVGLAWIGISLLGAIPFTVSRSIPNYIDALFETASGLSTTGASILQDFDGMPRADMFWRLFTHWIGGMGVLVFLMAVMPMSGEHSMHIMRAEVPGPTVGKLVPRVRHTAQILYMIYVGMTISEMVCLLLAGMSFYDAVLHAFATAGTGGFSTNAGSIAGFHNSAVEVVLTVFMLAFAVNFNLYYLLLIGSWRKALKNQELHRYAAIILIAVGLITFGICGTGNYTFRHGLHTAFFNVASILSTTGFGTVDFTEWPEYCKWIIILLMFCGGCAGGTGGGIKLSRIMILLRSLRAELQKMVRPRTVVRVEMDGQRVEKQTVRAASTFVSLYMILLLVFAALVSLDGHDVATCFTASLSCLSNIGPGITKAIGPAGSFAVFSGRSKLLLTLAMLIGRLEIYPILVLFSPNTWKK